MNISINPRLNFKCLVIYPNNKPELHAPIGKALTRNDWQYFKETGKLGSIPIPLDIKNLNECNNKENHFDQLMITGPDYEVFEEYFKEHKDQIPVKRKEMALVKNGEPTRWVLERIKTIKLGQALTRVMEIFKVSEEKDLNELLSNPEKLMCGKLQTSDLDKALKLINNTKS